MRPAAGAAVVTGASRGIGAACALALGRAGAPVVVNYRSTRERAEAVVAEIEAAGGRAIAVQADVRSADDVAWLAAHARRELGAVGIVVSNAAASFEPKSFRELAWEDCQRELEVTTRGFFLLAKAFLPEMSERGGGRLIAIGSAAASSPMPRAHAYVTAKAALAGLVRSLAREVGPSGVTVNQVVPPLTDTDRAGLGAGELAKHLARVPLGRLTTPEDVAGAVLYLASEEAGHLTGTSIEVDGGLSLT